MKVVLQRVSSAAVHVEGKEQGSIAEGLVVLCGFAKSDTAECISPMLEKILDMRLFPDERGRFHFSLRETGGGLLLVPQFTLFADTSKGRRPEFFSAKAPKEAAALFETLCATAAERAPGTFGCGVFGAHMELSLVNDGPVTISLEN